MLANQFLIFLMLFCSSRSRPSTRGTGGSRGTPTRGGRGGRGGRRSDNRPKKTQEELDAEMSEYMQIDEVIN